MIGSIKNKPKFFVLVIIFMVLLSTLFIINFKNKFKSENNKDEKYFYNYYINNADDLNKLINFNLDKNVVYIGKKECIICIDYKHKKINDIYFYTNKEINEKNAYDYANFIKKSIIKEVYLTSSNNYYVILLEQNDKKTAFLEYCKKDCNYENESKKEKKGNKIKYYTRTKINENWSLVYNSIE